MATHSSNLAWRLPWTEDPGWLQSTGSQRVGHDWETSLLLSSILAWKIPWTEEPGRLQSMRSQRVGHDWATSLHHVLTSHLYFFFDKMSVQLLAHFLVGLFVLPLSCKNFFYNLRTSSLSDISFENTFSHPVDCLFILSKVSFNMQEFSSLMQPHLLIFVSQVTQC